MVWKSSITNNGTSFIKRIDTLFNLINGSNLHIFHAN
jgi:hypothetical protein